MKYVILDISELNNIDYSQLPNHSADSVRRSLNGSKFIIKYDIKPSFITDEAEYSHAEILDIVAGSEWTQEFDV
jgi:hypothetical protein